MTTTFAFSPVFAFHFAPVRDDSKEMMDMDADMWSDIINVEDNDEDVLMDIDDYMWSADIVGDNDDVVCSIMDTDVDMWSDIVDDNDEDDEMWLDL
jgi:hypothetical protein